MRTTTDDDDDDGDGMARQFDMTLLFVLAKLPCDQKGIAMQSVVKK